MLLDPQWKFWRAAHGRSKQQSIAHLEKSIKTNETSSAAPLANLEILARALGVISVQQLDGTERIARSLQELTAALAAGCVLDVEGDTLRLTFRTVSLNLALPLPKPWRLLKTHRQSILR